MRIICHNKLKNKIKMWNKKLYSLHIGIKLLILSTRLMINYRYNLIMSQRDRENKIR